MLLPGRQGATEAEFYLKDYTADERESGKADHVAKFAAESHTERGASTRRGVANTEAADEAEAAKEAKVVAPEGVKV